MAATTVQVQMQQRRDTAANWTSSDPTLKSGEFGYETDTGRLKIGDGSTAWTSLAYLPLPDNTGEYDGNLVVTGNLTVQGTTTTVSTETLLVEDKNIEMGVVATPTDALADGGGITLKGTTDKTINWIDATDAWTFSEHVELASGKEFFIDGTSVLNATTLGSGITASSLTSVGTLTSLTVSGNIEMTGTGAIDVAAGTTAERPIGNNGLFRYNTDTNKFEGFINSAWGSVGGGATGGGQDDIFVENGQTVTTNYQLTANKNAMSAGPITINAGITVTIPSGQTWVIV